MKRIGCLHAHYSNISVLEDAFSAYTVELAHFVDPGLLLQGIGTCPPTDELVHSKLVELLTWISQCPVDAILITCTQYAASLTDTDAAAMPIPIFTIDGPFFDEVAKHTGQQLLLFSNPATVAPTMDRLWSHARAIGKTPAIDIQVVEGAFSLLMENKQDAYRLAVAEALRNASSDYPDAALSVAQLSMVPVARQFAKETLTSIAHPLQSLTTSMAQTLPLTEK